MKNKIIGVVVVVVLMGGSFWGGITYAKSQTPASGQTATGGFGGGAGRGGFTRGGGAAGQIVSTDATTMTIKLASGSTQLVLLGASTPIAKSVLGSAADLTLGTNVVITGQTNSDGSITAQSVQIRPTMPTKQ